MRILFFYLSIQEIYLRCFMCEFVFLLNDSVLAQYARICSCLEITTIHTKPIKKNAKIYWIIDALSIQTKKTYLQKHTSTSVWFFTRFGIYWLLWCGVVVVHKAKLQKKNSIVHCLKGLYSVFSFFYFNLWAFIMGPLYRYGGSEWEKNTPVIFHMLVMKSTRYKMPCVLPCSVVKNFWLVWFVSSTCSELLINKRFRSRYTLLFTLYSHRDTDIHTHRP